MELLLDIILLKTITKVKRSQCIFIHVMHARAGRETRAYFDVSSRNPRHCLGAWKFDFDIVLRSVLVGPSLGRTR